MYSAPDVWHALMGRLADITVTFLRAQVDAGVDAVQLFDSWAGALSERDYRRFVLPHSARVLARGGGRGRAADPLRRRHRRAARRDGGGGRGRRRRRLAGALSTRPPAAPAAPVQGNLDPAVLFADRASIEAEVRRILDEGSRAPGHVFNLGHGVLPETDPDVVTRLVELVHTREGAVMTGARVAVVGAGSPGLAAAHRLRDPARPRRRDHRAGAAGPHRRSAAHRGPRRQALRRRRRGVPRAAARGARAAGRARADRRGSCTRRRRTRRSARRAAPWRCPAARSWGCRRARPGWPELLSDAGFAAVAAEPTRPLAWTPGGDVALGRLLRARFGDELADRLVDPLLGGVYAGRVDALGLRPTMPALAAALDAGAASLTAAADAATTVDPALRHGVTAFRIRARRTGCGGPNPGAPSGTAGSESSTHRAASARRTVGGAAARCSAPSAAATACCSTPSPTPRTPTSGSARPCAASSPAPRAGCWCSARRRRPRRSRSTRWCWPCPRLRLARLLAAGRPRPRRPRRRASSSRRRWSWRWRSARRTSPCPPRRARWWPRASRLPSRA